MGIMDEDVVKVRDSADIVDVISEHVQLKRVGRRWSGLCPFHSEKSPSFSVNQEMGLYYCFGCGAKGDAITFLREMEHLDFVGAVERLANKTGIQLRYSDNDDGEGRKNRKQIIDMMREAVRFYHERLLSAPGAAEARSYLRTRGFSSDEVRNYQLGWADDQQRALADFLGGNKELLLAAGLAIETPQGTIKDFFQNRIMFPIFTPTGDPVAFGGRIMPGGQGPKYKNSASTPVYDKSRVLYGLNWAKANIVKADEAIICEGYTDVMGFSSIGFSRAVAPCGTALTEEHVKLLVNYTNKFVLAFDADGAGQNAAQRLLEWERQYGLNLVVALMPEGSDPGELARENPRELQDAVENAVPFLKFRVQRALRDYDLTTTEDRVRAADAALVIINEHPDKLVRDQYVMELGDHLKLSVEDLRTRKPTVPASKKIYRRVEEEVEPGNEIMDAKSVGLIEDHPELEALRVVLEDPSSAEIYHECLFGNETCRKLFRDLKDNGWDAGPIIEGNDVRGQLLQRLAVQESKADYLEVLRRLVEEAGIRELKVISDSVREVQDSQEILMLAEEVRWLKQKIEDMKNSDLMVDAVPDVFEWLTDRYMAAADA